MLEVVNANLLAGHRITRILSVLKIPRSTYYDYLHWQPSRTERRRHLIKQEVLTAWLRYPMYGYPRLTILLNQQSDIHVSQRLVYQQMCELGIRSRMVKRINKPTTQTDYDQRENNHYEKNNTFTISCPAACMYPTAVTDCTVRPDYI